MRGVNPSLEPLVPWRPSQAVIPQLSYALVSLVTPAVNGWREDDLEDR